jgi:hypothetical protein
MVVSVEPSGSTSITRLLPYLVTLASDAEHCALGLQAGVPRLTHVVLRAPKTAFDRQVLASGPICGHETRFLVLCTKKKKKYSFEFPQDLFPT